MPQYFCRVSEAQMASIGAWRKRHILWAVDPDDELPGIEKSEVLRGLSLGFDWWREVTPLKFSLTSDFRSADIRIKLGAIDFAGGVLAWSELPDGSDRPLNQQYDSRDSFVVTELPPRGMIDLAAVSCHEIGHALGLEHDKVGSKSLMEPTYSPGRRKPQKRDIARIQKLYPGTPDPSIPIPPTPVPNPTNPDKPDPVTISIYGADPEQFVKIVAANAHKIEIEGYEVKKKPKSSYRRKK